MSILIAAARQDEKGGIGGGQRGDQTGHEVESYFWNDRPGDGWNILRYKDPEKRKNAVKMMKQIIANPNVGYSQWTHNALIKAGRAVNWDFSKIDYPVDTDCCDLQRTLAVANGIEVGSCYTATQERVFMATGEFELLTGVKYAHTDRYLLAGDIGVMPPGIQGHTWMAIEDGDLAETFTESTYVVNCNCLIQRAEPSLNGKVLQYLPRNAAINVISYAEDKENGILWAQGEYKGVFGYCSTKYLVPAVQLPEFTTLKSTWLRSEPDASNNANRIVVIPPKQTFPGTGGKATASNGRVWHEVIYNTMKGWVSSLYITEK